MSIGNLLELIVCFECNTRVEYHDDRDGYMSCECKIRETPDDPLPETWIEIEDRLINECAGCKTNIPERNVFRCADCGRPFHRTCLDHHCKRGNQPEEMRSEILFLKSRIREWISTANAMPENFENVNIWTGVVVLEAYWDPGSEWFIQSFTNNKVVALFWQPLPPPPYGVSAALKAKEAT